MIDEILAIAWRQSMLDGERIPTNLRTLLILEVLGKSDRSLSPTEINHHIGLPKQTIHRLCTKLEDEGFLARDADGKRLRPNRRTRLMASGILHASHTHIMRHQVMQRLADQVGETVNFVVPDSKGMIYLDRIETDWPFRVQLPVGTHVPFHCTASGKTFLASISPKARTAMVRSLDLRKQTENTHRSSDSFLAELKQVAKQGFATDNEEFVDGMVAIAVPVCDELGRYVASVACHGPVQRLDINAAASLQYKMKAAAAKMREVLFA